jgi:hypothetical protein
MLYGASNYLNSWSLLKNELIMVTRRGFIQTIPLTEVGGMVPGMIAATSDSTQRKNLMNHREYWTGLSAQI